MAGTAVVRRVPRAPDVDPQLVRAWARAQGHPVSDRGRVPLQLVREYRSAHGLG
ncbi:Lsr2 family DNA-binding protein [Kineococcus glutinatus]|uniref:Lsr2 DNA-binding domain-containing protein n=1 Tax=Kineococcus glutinatus TaxID=1070872 RepID=A0ABP8VDP3_9ACTN